MAAFGRRLDIAALAVQGVTGALAGGINEQAYRQTETVGMAVTAVTLLGGVALKIMGNSPLMDQMGDALFLSGSSVSGWKLSQIVLPANGTPAAFQRRAAHQVPANRPAMPAGRPANRPAMPPAARPATSPAASTPRLNSGIPARTTNGHYPQVSMSGTNPNTGEQILHSRV